MSSGKLSGVIFDMDGVLVDSHAVHLKAWRLFFRTLGRDLADSELNFILDGRKREDILRHFLGNRPDLEFEEFGRRKDCIFRQMRLDVVPIPGVVRMVRELHQSGLILALATSASQSRAHSTLTDLGLLGCFQQITTGEDVLSGKPDAAIYRLACHRIGIAPEHLLAVEDAISGIRAAVGAGLSCLGVASHETPENLLKAGAVHVLRDFEGGTAEDLECILARRDRSTVSHQAAAGHS